MLFEILGVFEKLKRASLLFCVCVLELADPDRVLSEYGEGKLVLTDRPVTSPPRLSGLDYFIHIGTETSYQLCAGGGKYLLTI